MQSGLQGEIREILRRQTIDRAYQNLTEDTQPGTEEGAIRAAGLEFAKVLSRENYITAVHATEEMTPQPMRL